MPGPSASSASADSLPDDQFYPLKRATERIQLLFARDEGATALHVELAGRRLGELAAVASRSGTVRSELLAEIEAETEEAIAGLAKAEDKEKLGEQLLALTDRQQEVFQTVMAKAPERAKGGLEKAMERSKRGRETASAAIAGRDDSAGKNRQLAATTPGDKDDD